MHPDEDRYEGQAKATAESPKSLQATKVLHSLLNQLEDKLNPVLRPSMPQADAKNPEPVKSELMQELGYLQNRLNSLLERLHV